MILFAVNVMGGAISATNAIITAAKVDESIELADAQKNADRQTVLNYIYMALGLGVIFGVSWFTRKGKKRNDGLASYEKHHAVKHHHHNIQDKRYGTNRR